MLRRTKPALDDGTAAARLAVALRPGAEGLPGWVLAPADSGPGGGVAWDDGLGLGGIDVVAEPGALSPTWEALAPGGQGPGDRRLAESLVAAVVPPAVRNPRLGVSGRAAAALAAAAVLAAAVTGAALWRGRPVEVPVTAVVEAPGVLPVATAGPTGELVVSVSGDVRRPGLVRLPTGARVDDAVRAAGGLRPGAVLGALNLARRLADGEQVVVGAAAPAGAEPAAPAGKVDLNTATAEQLDGLPGVGPVLADRIVAWRTEHGRFTSVAQLREVSGIGESKYQQLKGEVVV